MPGGVSRPLRVCGREQEVTDTERSRGQRFPCPEDWPRHPLTRAGPRLCSLPFALLACGCAKAPNLWDELWGCAWRSGYGPGEEARPPVGASRRPEAQQPYLDLDARWPKPGWRCGAIWVARDGADVPWASLDRRRFGRKNPSNLKLWLDSLLASWERCVHNLIFHPI